MFDEFCTFEPEFDEIDDLEALGRGGFGGSVANSSVFLLAPYKPDLLDKAGDEPDRTCPVNECS